MINSVATRLLPQVHLEIGPGFLIALRKRYLHSVRFLGARNASLVYRFRCSSAHLSDTQEAISRFLNDCGLSDDDSELIASTSPRYLIMLEESVKELDEWTEWLSSDGANNEFKLLKFEDKIGYIARKKGDGGKVAFLESVGLSLNSSMNVARYLSGQSLPYIVEKVKYMRKMFDGSDLEGGVVKNCRRMMMHLSITTDEDLQRTLSFFEKIAAKRGGVDMLESSDSSFGYLVESFPEILLLAVDSHLVPLVDFFDKLGMPKHHIRRLFLLFPPVMTWDIKKLEERVRVFRKEDKHFSKMLHKYPWILSKCVQENYEEILSCVDWKKIPRETVEQAIEMYPYLLGCSASKLQATLNNFEDLGIRKHKMRKVLTSSPQLLVKKPHDFFQVVSFFKEIGFDHPTVGNLLERCPELFAANIELTLKRKLRFLSSIGVSENHILRAIKKYPELLVSDEETTLLPRIKYLMDLGLSERDIAFMIGRFSPLLGYSIDGVLKPKSHFLINIMQKPVKEVVDYPRYFSYSLEKKIQPRFWVLKGRNIECSLKDMLDKNNEEFAAHYMDDSVA